MDIERGPVAYAPSERGYVAHQVTGGHGPWVVLLPTLTASFASYWDLPGAATVLARLAAHCRLVLVDRRGTGPSDPLHANEAPDATAHAADVAAVLDHLDATEVTVIGESYAGGPAALRTAATVPERVARVVTINLPRTPVIGELDLDADRIVDDVLWGSESPEAEGLELLPSVHDDPSYAAWAERAGRATGPAVARGIWEEMLRFDLDDVLPAVSAPVTVVDTGHWSSPPASVAALAEGLSDATVVSVPRVDSLLFVGDTDELTSCLLEVATGERHTAPSTRALRAVLFTDLVGSTALAASLGDRAWRGRLDLHDRTVADAVAAHDGAVVKLTGDGALATFPLPSAAVACAVELLDRLGDAELPTRAGLHLGEVELRGDDLGGVAVHVAARVTAAAVAGELLVTEAVALATLGGGHRFGEPVSTPLRGVPGTWQLRALQR